MKFSELELPKIIKDSFKELYREEMTIPQEQVIKALSSEKDVLAICKEGMEADLAFIAAGLTKLNKEIKDPQILILVPNRQTAQKVIGEFTTLIRKNKKIKIAGAYGSASEKEQKRKIRKGAQIIVGTPGRIMSFIERGILSLEKVSLVVLDGVDEMFNVGFREDMEWTLDNVNENVPIIYLTESLKAPVQRSARKYLSNPVIVGKAGFEFSITDEESRAGYSPVNESKYKELTLLLEDKDKQGLVICDDSSEQLDLLKHLREDGITAERIEDDLNAQVLESFFDDRIIQVLISDSRIASLIDSNQADIIFNYGSHNTRGFSVHQKERSKKRRKKSINQKKSASAQYRTDEADLNELRESILNEKVKPHSRYYHLIEELKDKGYKAEYIAATLMDRIIPLKKD